MNKSTTTLTLVTACMLAGSVSAATPAYEDLTLHHTYHVMDTTSSEGVTMNFKPFFYADGSPHTGGYGMVIDSSHACQADHELMLNNINCTYDFASSIGSQSYVRFAFGEYAGNINMDVNGDMRNTDNFIDLDGLTIGGVLVHVPYGGAGDDCGKLELTGHVKVLAIGGQECWIDCLEGDVVTAPNGDANGDGSVNVQDLLELLTQWGQCSGSCSADFNGDQSVNVMDLLIMLENWG